MKKLNIIDKEEKDHCLMKASDMDRRIAGEEGVDDQRGPNQEMGMQVNIVGEAGEDHQLTPIPAAELFAEKYLPDLSKKSVSLPRERVDYGCSTQVFLSDKQRGKAEFANEKEESDFHKYKNFTTGAEAEINVLKYIEKSIDGPFAMFWSYTQLKTYRFLGIKEENKITDKPGDWNTEQEYDLLILLPRQKLFVIFEVKSYVGKLQKKTLDPLIRGKRFFYYLQEYIGDKSWRYVPVVALPNVESRDKAQSSRFEQKLDFVLVTADTMKNNNFLDVLMQKNVIAEDQSNNIPDITYMKLAKILYASAHAQEVTRSSGNIGLKLVDLKFKIRDKEFVVSAPENPLDKTHEKLFGKEEDSVSAGFNSNVSYTGDVQFSDLKNTGIGDIKSMIFWNPDQYKVIHSNHEKMVITGEFGTGKTLLLMSKLQRLCDNNENIMLVCDSSISSQIFDARMRTFCTERSIEFSSINLKDERGKFEEFCGKGSQCHLLIDELDCENFEYVCSTTRKMAHVTCVINPQNIKKVNSANSLRVPGDWIEVCLSRVMRNSTSIYNAACNDYSSQEVATVTTSTVVGKKPQAIYIADSDWYLGVITALSLFEQEDKIVILKSNDIKEIELSASLSFGRPDIPIYYSRNEEDINEFLECDKGCFICHYTEFSRMEGKNLIIIDPAILPNGFAILEKDWLLRCSAHLICISHSSSLIRNITPEYMDYIVPYETKSEIYGKVFRNLENKIVEAKKAEFLRKVNRTMHRSNFQKFTNNEAHQLRSSYMRRWLDVLLQESRDSRNKRIKKLSKPALSDLSEEVERWRQQDKQRDEMNDLSEVLKKETTRRFEEEEKVELKIKKKILADILQHTSMKARTERITQLSKESLDERRIINNASKVTSWLLLEEKKRIETIFKKFEAKKNKTKKATRRL